MAQIILSVENSTRSTTVFVTRHPRVIADVIRKFARQRGVSPLSVEYRIG
jgi:hypothetical protein